MPYKWGFCYLRHVLNVVYSGVGWVKIRLLLIEIADVVIVHVEFYGEHSHVGLVFVRQVLSEHEHFFWNQFPYFSKRVVYQI